MSPAARDRLAARRGRCTVAQGPHRAAPPGGPAWRPAGGTCPRECGAVDDEPCGPGLPLRRVRTDEPDDFRDGRCGSDARHPGHPRGAAVRAIREAEKNANAIETDGEEVHEEERKAALPWHRTHWR